MLERKKSHQQSVFCLSILSLMLMACSSDETSFTVGGTVTGLEGTLIIQNNGRDDLTITQDQSFTFPTPIKENYIVTISRQPTEQTCRVANSIGTATANVTDVEITCEDRNNSKIIFITSDEFLGDINGNGIEQADEECNNDPAKPDLSTYKAMLVDGIHRNACTNPDCTPSGGSIDWVLLPNTQYIRPDGTVIGTTNSNAIFESPLDNSPEDVGVAFWIGFEQDWTDSTDDCANWTVGDGIEQGASGNSANLEWFLTGGDCDFPAALVCVEQ